MKPSTLFTVLLVTAISVSVSAQGKGKKNPPAKLTWRVQQLHKDNNEGLAIGDIDGDGSFDITAGAFWYQAPDWKQRPLRKLGAFGADYTTNNGEHLYDMDGAGDLDVLAGTFMESIVYWYENPGPGDYDVDAWPVHEWMDTGTGQNEATFMEDVDVDPAAFPGNPQKGFLRVYRTLLP